MLSLNVVFSPQHRALQSSGDSHDAASLKRASFFLCSASFLSGSMSGCTHPTDVRVYICVHVCKMLGRGKDRIRFCLAEQLTSLVASKHFPKWALIGFLLFYFYFVVILMYREPAPSNETFYH